MLDSTGPIVPGKRVVCVGINGFFYGNGVDPGSVSGNRVADEIDIYIEKKQEGQKSLINSNLREQGEVEPTEHFQGERSPNWHPEPVILPGHNIELHIHGLQDIGDPRCKINFAEKSSGQRGP